MTTSSSALRRGVFHVALALVVVITAWSTRIGEGHRSIEACDAAVKRGDRVEAIVFARAAAEARCPWCEAPELGYARLYAIAKDAESRGDNVTAVAAWRAFRAAALGTAVLGAHPARRQRADIELARLEHRLDAAASAAGRDPSPAATEGRLRAALAAASPIPSGAVFAFVSVGGVLFLLGAVRFTRTKEWRTTNIVMALAGAALTALGVLVF